MDRKWITPEDSHLVLGTTVQSSYTKEMHKNYETLKHNGQSKTVFAAVDSPKVEIDLSYLPAASETYQISSNPSDYILMFIPIVTVDIPNRNLQSFPFEEVSYFDPQHGKPVFKTFEYKPLYIDHCFPAGTMIRMANNTEKAIENIEVGDMILTGKGKPAPVKRLYNNGVKSITKLIATGTLSEIYATDNHPFYVVGRGQVFGKHIERTNGRSDKYRHSDFREQKYEPHFRPVSDIYHGDYLCIPINYGGQTKVDPNFAFLVGAFLAEGYYISKNDKHPHGSGIDLICGSHEKEFIEKIIVCAKELGYQVTHKTNVSQGADSIRVFSTKLASEIRSLCNEYSHGKRLQGDIRNWDIESTKIMLGGYMSGDGCFDKKKGSFRCRSSSRQLLIDLQQAFAFVGIPVCIGIDEPVTEIRKRRQQILDKDPDSFVIIPNYDSGFVRISNYYIPQMRDYLVGKVACNTDSKYDNGRLILQDGFIMSPIIGIEKNVSQSQVYNFEVDHEEHSYIANSLIVHNCNQIPHKASGLIVDAGMQYIPKYDLWKIVIAGLWDRTKNSSYAKGIESGKYNSYSMGSYVMNFVCSVCGKNDNMDANSCIHMKQKGSTWGPDKRLAFQMCISSSFFETSLVTNDPADPTATSEEVYK